MPTALRAAHVPLTHHPDIKRKYSPRAQRLDVWWKSTWLGAITLDLNAFPHTVDPAAILDRAAFAVASTFFSINTKTKESHHHAEK